MKRSVEITRPEASTPGVKEGNEGVERQEKEGEERVKPNQETTESKADVEQESRTSLSRKTQTVNAMRVPTTAENAAIAHARGETATKRAIHSKVDELDGDGV